MTLHDAELCQINDAQFMSYDYLNNYFTKNQC